MSDDYILNASDERSVFFSTCVLILIKAYTVEHEKMFSGAIAVGSEELGIRGCVV